MISVVYFMSQIKNVMLYLDAIVVLRTYIEESNFLCQTGFEMFPVFVDGKLGRCTHAQEQQDVR